MIQDVYDPLTEYAQVFRDRFKRVAEDTFAELASEARVDVAANHETCKTIYSTQKLLDSVTERLGRWKFLCVFLWLLTIASITAVVVVCVKYLRYSDLYEPEQLLLPKRVMYAAIAVVVVSVIIQITKVYPRKKSLKAEQEQYKAVIAKHKADAWNQMAPLNKLYDWDILTRMMSKTVPRLEFDPFFTTKRLADLERTYSWDSSFNATRSVLYSHSGLINGNPFVLCRTKRMEMGSKTYYGHKTIHWTTVERGSDGKSHTVHHSETLTASVTAPFPGYYEETRLIYGNTAAPDLTFHRKQNDLAGREHTSAFRRSRRKLKRKARNLENGDFALMTNHDFEVVFNSSDRNNNQQFALLFTPLAQESMLKLLRDQTEGYGDDFDFIKQKMINTIVPDHLQDVSLDMNPNQFSHFDFEKAKLGFIQTSSAHFRAIYFAFAPLLCVPMYQQIRPQEDIYGRDMAAESAFWEHEALANYWGNSHFKHPKCVTDCILKTERHQTADNAYSITVHAHGYRMEQRLTYIEKWGGDGRLHSVPVYWDEYIAVTGQGEFKIQEDHRFETDTPITQTQRMEHISSFLSETDLTRYRRHIASKA